MIALDTNVLARVLNCDNAKQTESALSLIERNPCFVAITVMLELEWVMRSSYKLDKKTIAHSFSHLMQINNLHFEHEARLKHALKLHVEGLDFADALHHVLALGCDSFATFDKEFSRQSGSLGLEPAVTLLS